MACDWQTRSTHHTMSSGRDEAKPWPLSDLKQGLAADYYAVCEATIPPLVMRFNERHAACAAQFAAATAKALDEYDRAVDFCVRIDGGARELGRDDENMRNVTLSTLGTRERARGHGARL